MPPPVAAAQPGVALSAPRMVTQNADILATAVFSVPSPFGDDAPSHAVPRDARFVVRTPGTFTMTFDQRHPTVRASGDSLQVAVKASSFGDWYVRVEGTLLVNGQEVIVADERLVHVASSVFA